MIPHSAPPNADLTEDHHSGSDSGYRNNPVLPAIPEKGDVSKILRDKSLIKGVSKRNTAVSQSRLGVENAVASGRYANTPLTAQSDVG